jgi:hypothetical protein
MTYYLYAIMMSTCAGNYARLRCNDIYVRAVGPDLWNVNGVELGQLAPHEGVAVIDSNRMCVDGTHFSGATLDGMGGCVAGTTPTVHATNNVIESAGGFGGGRQGIEFYSCEVVDISVVLTNNVIVAPTGVTGSGGPPSVRWRLTNNVIYSDGGGSGAGVDAGGVIESSEHNLVFGFSDNVIYPAPLLSSFDDTGGGWTAGTVFVDAAGGDFHPLAGGPAVGAGLDVFGDVTYGSVTHDLGQDPRPAGADWDRGAYLATP